MKTNGIHNQLEKKKKNWGFIFCQDLLGLSTDMVENIYFFPLFSYLFCQFRGAQVVMNLNLSRVNILDLSPQRDFSDVSKAIRIIDNSF